MTVELIQFEPFADYQRQGILSGVYVNGCILGKAMQYRAHTHRDIGIVCVRKDVQLLDEDLPSTTMLHELAHLLSPEAYYHDGHTKEWQTIATDLGVSIDLERYWWLQ